MKSIFAFVVSATYAGLVGAEGEKLDVTPVQKVLQLLEGMIAKGKEEKHAEGVQYAQYKAFCEDTEQEKTRAIKKAEEEIAILKAEIAKAAADSDQLIEEIAEHDEDVRNWDVQMKKATADRKTANSDYKTLHADYTESLSAITRAQTVMAAAIKNGDAAQAGKGGDDVSIMPVDDAASMLQNSSVREASSARREAAPTSPPSRSAVLLAVKNLKLVPDEAKEVMGSFLARDAAMNFDDDSDSQPIAAPEANAYDFQSSVALEMLKKLFDKFTAERTTIEMEEAKSKQAYEMLMEELTRETQEAVKMSQDKTKQKNRILQTKATKQLELEKIEYDKAADEKYLKEVSTTCVKKASDFESRNSLRTEEISTLETAVKIITDESTLHEGRYTTFLQYRRTAAVALAHLRSDEKTQVKTRLAQYLQGRAKELKSQVLAMLADKAAQDHFGKVKKMIKDLLVRLEEEAAAEASHKAWCDEQMATNKETRMDKTADVEMLTADIEELNGNIVKLIETSKTATKEINALDVAMAKATTIRQKEEKTNKKTIADSILAQKATASAITVLKEFYRDAGKAEVLLQEKQAPLNPNPDDPVGNSGPATKVFNDVEGQEKAYTGMQGEKDGVIGMLEVILSDFTRLESETRASETSATDEYDDFMVESVANKEEKLRSRRRAELTKLDHEQVIEERKEDLATTQTELNAALDYFEKLKIPCIDSGGKYNDRVNARDAEVESLKNCWKILNGEDLD